MPRPFLKFAGAILLTFCSVQNAFGSQCQTPLKWQDKRLSLQERINEFNKCEIEKGKNREGKYFCFTEYMVGTEFSLTDGTFHHSGAFEPKPEKFFITIKKIQLPPDHFKNFKCLESGMTETLVSGPPSGSPGGVCFANFSLEASDGIGETFFVSYDAFKWRGTRGSFHLDSRNNFSWHQSVVRNHFVLSGICEKIN